MCTLICIEKNELFTTYFQLCYGYIPLFITRFSKVLDILLGGYLNTIRPTTEVHFAGVFSKLSQTVAVILHPR